MAGLLDGLFATPSDQALWALGSGLLGVRRGNEGRAMMGAMGAYNDAQQEQRRNSLVDLQRQQIEGSIEDRRARAKAEADAMLMRQRIRDGLPPDVQGAFEIDPGAWARSQFERPKQGASTDIGKLRVERDALPPGHPDRALYEAAIKKATEFAPPMQLQMPGPVTYLQGMGPSGPEFFRAPTRGETNPTPTGIRPVPPPTNPTLEKERMDKEASARKSQQVLSTITQARELLSKNPTSSGIGAALDTGRRFFGGTTDSAQVASQLETLSGWMVANVPRMEGPQSNFDVENYRVMAAKVGDRTTPIAERLAALQILEDLQRKYADINGTPLPAPSGPNGGAVKRGESVDLGGGITIRRNN